MAFQAATRAFFQFLQANPSIRAVVRADVDRTLLYSGKFGRPMWGEIDQQRRLHGNLLDKQTLPDVLDRIPVPGPYASLKAQVEHIERQVPWQPDGFTVWRVLSGLFAANATGKVSFLIGGEVTADTKVFGATEIGVLARNPNVDPLTKTFSIITVAASTTASRR